MKKLIALLLCAAMLCTVSAAFAEAPDTYTSASVADYYGAAALTGDDLMNAINSFSGFYLHHQSRWQRQRGLFHLWLREARG